MSVEGSAPAVFIHNQYDRFWAGLLLLLSSSSSSQLFFFFFFLSFFLSLREPCPVFVFTTKPTWWGNLTPRSITRLSCFSAAFQKASRPSSQTSFPVSRVETGECACTATREAREFPRWREHLHCRSKNKRQRGTETVKSN